MTKTIHVLIAIVTTFTLTHCLYAQNGGQKYIRKGLSEFTDSLKAAKYPFIFPAWGDKVMEKGFDLPLPHGVMLNLIQSRQNILIENMRLGVNGSDLRDVSDFIRFRKIEVNAKTTNVRPDVWLLPFFNVYGLLGYLDSDTEVNVGLPIELTANSTNEGLYYGLGFLIAGGFGPVWVSFDYNQAWAKLELLDKASRVRVNGIRIGHTYVSKRKPQQNIAIWVGGQFQKLASETQGEVALQDVLAIPPERLDEIINNVTEWFNGLSPLEQEVMRRVFDSFLDFVQEGVDATIQYQFDKNLANPWSLAIGAQWQLNKIWQLRGEFNFLGSRTQGMISLNYRFGVRGRNFLDRTND